MQKLITASHEYTFDDNTHLHYCNDHETLIIVNHEGVTTNRLMITIPKEAIKNFITDMNKEALEAVTND